ncbi:hypothetical protein C7S16_0091 [Burkholderia thailandensis]|uniref:Uncharacterized protein n=1 Tax=Burkholderia thailandensis TaxID=57975 RepID=A0AAW9D2S9_BURTH|nr:hypothetical protein [Burkholderia thailandensis]MDW9255988.1 hypothetical protein [Burkholderia thailandensis]
MPQRGAGRALITAIPTHQSVQVGEASLPCARRTSLPSASNAA